MSAARDDIFEPSVGEGASAWIAWKRGRSNVPDSHRDKASVVPDHAAMRATRDGTVAVLCTNETARIKARHMAARWAGRKGRTT